MGPASLIPGWLPVAVPWAGAVLLAALPRRPLAAGAAVAVASLGAAVAEAAVDGAGRPDALRSALLLAGAVVALLVAVARVGAPIGRYDRISDAAFPLLQGAHALAVLAPDAVGATAGLAVGAGAGAALVALSGGRRAAVAAWRMLLPCGAGLALALFGAVLLGLRGAAGAPGLSESGFALLLLGYGALAGLAPMGAWLPGAMAVSTPPVASALAGLLLPAALHALLRAATAASGPAFGGLVRPTLMAAVGLATVLLAATATWRRPGAAERESLGWSAAGLAGLAAVGFGVGGAPGDLAGVLLLLGLPFCVGAAVLGAAAGGGPVAALGRASLAGVPPFAPFVALVLLFSSVAALPAGLALPLGAALLAAAAVQLGAAARARGGGTAGVRRSAIGAERRERLLLAGPPWLLIGLALLLGAALPAPVAAVLAEAARGVR